MIAGTGSDGPDPSGRMISIAMVSAAPSPSWSMRRRA
jgi:hypothetical protein